MKKFKYIFLSFVIMIIAVAAIPYLFPLIDSREFTGNYRIPYSSGYDYFLYDRYAKQVSSMNVIPVMGDSVIWGHYTESADTLSANLNRLSKKTKFMNMGLDGIHPAAMKGLVEMNSSYLRGRRIIAGINLLWMSSPRHDLTGHVNTEINHKLLLPQFYPRIPSYAPSFEEKLSSVINRSVHLLQWIDHMKLNCFAGKSFYLWTMDNPGKCPAEYFSVTKDSFIPPRGMVPEKMQEQYIDWVDIDKSLQWRFMVETLVMLKNNGSKIAAVITPFNTHMMDGESRKKYFSVLADMESVLRSEGITILMPLKPDRKYFADASHPTSEGYYIIAREIMKNAEFIRFLAE